MTNNSLRAGFVATAAVSATLIGSGVAAAYTVPTVEGDVAGYS